MSKEISRKVNNPLLPTVTNLLNKIEEISNERLAYKQAMIMISEMMHK